jgi:hypothetical protein
MHTRLGTVDIEFTGHGSAEKKDVIICHRCGMVIGVVAALHLQH